jgi:hypothetical protein
MKKFPEIPKSYLAMALIVGLVVLRAVGIDSYITASLGLVVGYVFGKGVGQTVAKN